MPNFEHKPRHASHLIDLIKKKVLLFGSRALLFAFLIAYRMLIAHLAT